MLSEKNAVWQKWLEFDSIRTYLNGSIGSKSGAIGDKLTLQEKVNNVRLSQYLLGVKNFLVYSKYMFEEKQFERKFNECYEILDYIDDLKSLKDRKKWGELLVYLDNYTIWLMTVEIKDKEENIVKKKFSGKTSINYQAQLRGYLNWNGAGVKLKTKEERSEVSKEQHKWGVEFDELKKLGMRMIFYAPDFELKTLLNWLFISGLGKAELTRLTMGELKHLDWNKEFVKIEQNRQKTGVDFMTFLYGDVKKDVKKFIDTYEYTDREGKVFLRNKDKDDDDYVFGHNPDRAQTDINFNKKFENAYNRMISTEFPEYKEAKQKLFTMHKYRHIFQTTCDTLRIAKPYENSFVGHKQFGTDKSYKMPNAEKMLVEFKKIQEELIGVKESTTREQIENEIIANFTQALLDKGKRKSIFSSFSKNNETDKNEIPIEMKTNILVESIIQEAKNEILDNPMLLVNDEKFISTLISNDDFIKGLIKRIDNARKSINF